MAVTMSGAYTYSALIFAFVLIPLVEAFVPKAQSNLDPEEAKAKVESPFFDLLLYTNVFIVYGLLYLLLNRVTATTLTSFEMIGMVGSIGTVFGACGINVAHELGHKPGRLPQFASKALLLPCLYMHFFIEHNRGHHLNVGTPDDPATSRYGEHVYAFWWRSVRDSYLHAWEIENQRMTKMGKAIASIDNAMIHFHLIQVSFLAVVWMIFGLAGLAVAIAVAVIAFLLLETINYIEHYGLQRRKLDNGRYERVEVFHSWNSNHELGRVILYELTRHSDHHYKANKKYQVLNHYDESPQLPLGYPTSMLLSFVPPLWFKTMNPLVKAYISTKFVATLLLPRPYTLVPV
jgi:alkane 1-monooxygenase